MSNAKKYITLAFLLIALVAMFLPIASFHDNSSQSLEADIAKAQERVKSASDQLQRWIDGGTKTEEQIQKQRDKVDKEQGKLDALLEQQAAAANAETSEGLSYSLLPNQLPEVLEIDQTVINQYKTYQTNMPGYNICVWVAFGLTVVAAVLLVLTGNKPVSKLYTFSIISHFLALVLSCYNVLRLSAFPIKLPYGNASLHTVTVLMLLLGLLISFAVHVSSVRNSKRTMIYIFCSFLSLLAIIPFWIMIVNGTRNSMEIQQGVSLLPSRFVSYNWDVLKTHDFRVWTGFRNSAIIAFGSTILSVYFSAMTAYGFKVYRFKGNKLLYAIVLAIIMIPGQVTGTGFYMFMYQLHLTNNFIPLVIPSIAAAGTVFFFRQYLEANFQISLVEAGRIDGAGEYFIFNRIVLPIMVPAMATMGIMAVIGSWNNYLTPLMLLSEADLRTLPMMVNDLRGDAYRTEFGSIYLGLTLTALPLMIVYFAFSKYIIAGVALGGVKE